MQRDDTPEAPSAQVEFPDDDLDEALSMPKEGFQKEATCLELRLLGLAGRGLEPGILYFLLGKATYQGTEQVRPVLFASWR